MSFLSLVWAGLWSKRARTLFTLLSVMVAFLLFGMLQGINAAFNRGVEDANVDRLYVNSRINFTEPLPVSYLQSIEKIAGVTGAAYSSWFGAYYREAKNGIFSFPIDAERYLAIYPEINLPSAQREALLHTRTGAVIGIKLAEKYGWKIGDQVSLHSLLWSKLDGSADWTFDIVGIFDNTEDHDRANSFLFNYSYFDEARLLGRGKVGWFIVKLGDPKQAAQVAAAIDKRFANSADETKTQTEKESAQAFLKQIGDINFFVGAIINAVFFTLLFLIGNTMMRSVHERIPEFAVLKAIGFADGTILKLVLAESMFLCGLAALLGLAVAALLFPSIKDYIGVARLPAAVIVQGVFIASLLALITGLPPAIRAKRLAIVDALAGR